MKKTPMDKLGVAIDQILEDYYGEVKKDAGELAKKFARKGAQAVRGNAQSQGWGEHTGYASGWTSQYEENRYSMQGTIYNKKVPGLPHLLEYGHALRNGGRTKAVPHITPVEEKVTEEFYKAVKELL